MSIAWMRTVHDDLDLPFSQAPGSEGLRTLREVYFVGTAAVHLGRIDVLKPDSLTAATDRIAIDGSAGERGGGDLQKHGAYFFKRGRPRCGRSWIGLVASVRARARIVLTIC